MDKHFTQLTPSFFVTQSAAYAATNSGVILSDGHAGLIDPGLEVDEIAAIAQFVHERAALTTTMLLTHSHFDHVLGPEQVRGATIVTHAAFPTTLQMQESGLRRMLAAWEAERSRVRPAAFRLPQPDRVFEQSMELAIGTQRFELLHAPGHHADQFVVYQHSSGLLWAADMLSDLEIPYIEQSLQAYRRTLEMLAARDIRILIPGHGTPTHVPSEIDARLAQDRHYLAELEAQVERCLREGRSVQQTVVHCDGMTLRQQGANTEAHRRNVETAYLELGGTGDPARVGWGQYY